MAPEVDDPATADVVLRLLTATRTVSEEDDLSGPLPRKTPGNVVTVEHDY